MLTDTLYALLADHFEASMEAQGAHWNVEGINFQQYHDLFSNIYEDWYGQVDVLAEYIRTVSSADVYVQSNLNAFGAKKTIKTSSGSDPKVLVGNLSKTNMAIRTAFLNLKKEASDFPGLMNYCDERINAHDKLNWMLKATLK